MANPAPSRSRHPRAPPFQLHPMLSSRNARPQRGNFHLKVTNRLSKQEFAGSAETAEVGLPRPHFSNILSSLPPPHVFFTPGLHHPPSLKPEGKGRRIWEFPWRRGEEPFPRTPGKHLASHWPELGHVPSPDQSGTGRMGGARLRKPTRPHPWSWGWVIVTTWLREAQGSSPKGRAAGLVGGGEGGSKRGSKAL